MPWSPKRDQAREEAQPLGRLRHGLVEALDQETANVTLAMHLTTSAGMACGAAPDTIASTTCMNGALSKRDEQGRRGTLEEQ